MIVSMTDRPEWKGLTSPRNNKEIPIYRWFPYKHGFSRDLVNNLIEEFHLQKGSWVLDPFCGSGTTLLACKQKGINSIGFDILPFSVHLSNVKLRRYKIRTLLEQENFIKEKLTTDNRNIIDTGLFETDVSIVKKAFDSAIEKELVFMKRQIGKVKDKDIRLLFTIGYLSVLEQVSKTSKSGGFLRIIDRKVAKGLATSLFLSKISSMINDLSSNNNSDCKAVSVAKLGDARRIPTRRKFDAVITSPPYPNRHDYTRIYTLEMVVGDNLSNEDLKKIRYHTLRSHVEARERFKAVAYRKSPSIDLKINEMIINGLNNEQVIGMLYGYLEDMYLTLVEIRKHLYPTGKVAMIISNVRFAGVSIPVDELVSEIGLQAGLQPLSILTLKYKGNSSQQMKKYKREPSRESIIIWGKNDN